MSRRADTTTGSLTDCEFCGRAVPITNLQLHQVNECSVAREMVDMYRGRGGSNDSTIISVLTSASIPPASDFVGSQFDDVEADDLWWTKDQHDVNMICAISSGEQDEDRKRSSRAMQATVVDMNDYQDYDVDDDCVIISPVVSSSTSTSLSGRWTCIDCTLENEQWRSQCAACELERVPVVLDGSTHDADRVGLERLVDYDDYMAMFELDSTTLDIPSIFEATRHGRSVASRAMPAALSGEFSEDYPFATTREQSVEAHMLPADRATASHNPYRRRRHTAASAVVAHPVAPSPRFRRRRRNRGNDGDYEDVNQDRTQYMMGRALASLQIQDGSMMGQHRQQPQPTPQHPNLDYMSYEQLLSVFGDGSEEMGGSEADIQCLPVVKLDNPQSELPPDCRQCSICLEDFEQHDQRKMLPCLHGFHEHCADTWLRTKGFCPVCKTRIRAW